MGCIGLMLDPESEGVAVLKHISVLPICRKQGVGRALLDAALSRLHIESLVAETDGDAVAVYQRWGFCILSLGESLPGVERFQCILLRSNWSSMRNIKE